MDALTIASDLGKVEGGSLASSSFVHLYMPFLGHPLVESVLAGFHHFVADEDIRKKDPAYADMQRNELRKMVSLLRVGASPDQIRSITFLK